MSRPLSEIQRHRFGPRVKGGIVFGLRGGQLGIMTAVLVLMTIAVRSTSSIAGALAGLAVFGAGLAIAFLPIRRRALDQWLPGFASYLNPQLSGHTRWLSRRTGCVERPMPEDPGALRPYALEKTPELVGTRTGEEVETRLEELPELRANHIRGYLEGVELTGPAARQHECFVSLELDTSSQRVAKQCKRIGRGDVQRGACEVLMRAIADLEERLATSLDRSEEHTS